MTRKHLFDAVKEKAGVKSDRELGDIIGCVKSFVSMMRSGAKNIPDAVFEKIEAIGISSDRIKDLIGLEDEQQPSDPVQPVLDVQRAAPDAEPVLQGAVSGGGAEAPAEIEVRAGAEGGRPAVGERIDPPCEPGAEASAPVAVKPARRKRGTIDGTVLKEGQIYYPKKHSAHSHRRITGLARNDKASYVLYSIGSDSIHVCQRAVFLRWIDPAKTGLVADVNSDSLS